MAGNKKELLPAPVEMFFNAVGRDEMIQRMRSKPPPTRGTPASMRLLIDVKPITVLDACKKTKTTLGDFVDAFHKYQVHLGTVRLMKHIPQVMEDVGEDAKSKAEPCMRLR